MFFCILQNSIKSHLKASNLGEMTAKTINGSENILKEQ